jgi:hypothetical protein
LIARVVICTKVVEVDVCSEESGLVFSRLNLPPVKRGDDIFHGGNFDKQIAAMPLFDDFS